MFQWAFICVQFQTLGKTLSVIIRVHSHSMEYNKKNASNSNKKNPFYLNFPSFLISLLNFNA